MNIGEIAKQAGVSRSTVSYVLSGKRQIGESTRARVMAIIDQANYRPSATARALAHGATNMIALVVPRLHHHLNIEILQFVGADRRSRRGGWFRHVDLAEWGRGTRGCLRPAGRGTPGRRCRVDGDADPGLAGGIPDGARFSVHHHRACRARRRARLGRYRLRRAGRRGGPAARRAGPQPHRSGEPAAGDARQGLLPFGERPVGLRRQLPAVGTVRGHGVLRGRRRRHRRRLPGADPACRRPASPGSSASTTVRSRR